MLVHIILNKLIGLEPNDRGEVIRYSTVPPQSWQVSRGRDQGSTRRRRNPFIRLLCATVPTFLFRPAQSAFLELPNARYHKVHDQSSRDQT